MCFSCVLPPRQHRFFTHSGEGTSVEDRLYFFQWSNDLSFSNFPFSSCTARAHHLVPLLPCPGRISSSPPLSYRDLALQSSPVNRKSFVPTSRRPDKGRGEDSFHASPRVRFAALQHTRTRHTERVQDAGRRYEALHSSNSGCLVNKGDDPQVY